MPQPGTAYDSRPESGWLSIRFFLSRRPSICWISSHVGEVQQLLDVINKSTQTGLRDSALLRHSAYTFARIGVVVNLKVQDYYQSGKRFFLRFKEQGGKEKELPVHHKLEELLDEYLKATGLGNEPDSLFFPAALGKTGKLSRRPLVRTDAVLSPSRRNP
jgi:integrase/recombinase XerD